jgi:hypothetical protein
MNTIKHNSRVQFTYQWLKSGGVLDTWMAHTQGTVLKLYPCGNATFVEVEWDNGVRMHVLSSYLTLAKHAMLKAA